MSLGDVLDRGPGSRAVLDLLMRLQREAEAAGGRLHARDSASVLFSNDLSDLTLIDHHDAFAPQSALPPGFPGGVARAVGAFNENRLRATLGAWLDS